MSDRDMTAILKKTDPLTDEEYTVLQSEIYDTNAYSQRLEDRKRREDDVRAQASCPFAIGDEIEQKTHSGARRYCVVRISSKSWGNLSYRIHVRQILKSGKLGKSLKELWYGVTSAKKVGHRELPTEGQAN